MADINAYMLLLKYQSIRTKGKVLTIQLPVYKVVINPDLNSAKMTLPLSFFYQLNTVSNSTFNWSEFLIDSIFRSNSTQLRIFFIGAHNHCR